MRRDKPWLLQVVKSIFCNVREELNFPARFAFGTYVKMFVLLFLISLSFDSAAQKSKTQKKAKTPPSVQKTKPKAPETVEVGAEDQKVKDIIAFLQFVLNSIGSKDTPVREKDVLITQSYEKIFRDAKVQVEDDLDTERTVITNKDVVAYLKDVDFFFTDVKFDFIIEDIKSSTLGNGNRFYKVSTRRNLSGTSSEGKVINNTQPRFIEINYNPDDQDLKIVSIYTKEFDQKAALTAWWKELSHEWQSIFRQKLKLVDSVRYDDIKTITAIQEMDLTGNVFIRSIDPLAQLLDLKKLNLARTSIEDLSALRNLTELESLDISGTKVFDLTPLKYAVKLKELIVDNTTINDIAVLEKMTDLASLSLTDTKVYDFNALSNLVSLTQLDLSGTQLPYLASLEKLSELNDLNLTGTLVQDLSPLKGLKKLGTLTIDSTRIHELAALASLENLTVLSANYTNVADLSSLSNLKKLEKVYCDQTPITKDQANAFMALNPNVLVVYDSKDLIAWWNALSVDWQQAFSTTAKLNESPAQEDGVPSKDLLARVTNLDSINITGKKGIKDLEPLRRLLKLKTLKLANTGVTDLSPLEGHREIKFLDIRDTEIIDLFVVRQFKNLSILLADRTKIQNIDPLYGLLNLEKVFVDQTTVQDIVAKDYLEKNPRVLLVYKTNHLNRWWKGLSPDWKEIFYKTMGSDTTSTSENLHRLVESRKIEFKDVLVDDLSAFTEFVLLQELKFAGTAIRSIGALENFKTLKVLHASRGPLRDINFVGQLPALEELDISNTPVEELDPLSNLSTLKILNCAGTQVKKLDPLEHQDTLESLDCSNTPVKNLSPVYMIGLRSLKCYNTKVTSKEVEKFVERNKECKVMYYR